MHLDLHLHTTCSDGAATPEEAVALARRGGLSAIAVTDHDTTAGCERARIAAVPLGLVVIAGIEISCLQGGSEMHLLGYGVTPDHPDLLAVTARLAALRRERLGTILGRLRALDVKINEDDVTTPEGNRAVGRPHVAEALVRLGVVRHPQEAFNRFLGVGQPAYVPSRGPDVEGAIAAVHEAGGCAVWAHPSLQDARRFGALARIGLDGVEVLRPNVSPTASSALEHAARETGLLCTGGSDWHGGNPPLGSWYVTERHVGALLERLGITQDERRPIA
ncbi:MAG: PHP domain-containing protein [Gemmatimonadales bacterium]